MWGFLAVCSSAVLRETDFVMIGDEPQPLALHLQGHYELLFTTKNCIESSSLNEGRARTQYR